MTSKLFSELGLSPAVLKAIDRLGYEKAAPIQSEAIPLIMGGSDVVGQSQTGSGKTAAFGIPAVECVDPHLRAVQVIIVCPTRELAVQVAEEIFKLSVFKKRSSSSPNLRWSILRPPDPGLEARWTDCSRYTRPNS
jgi:ATP-dependent RNA helicase DeaD